MTLLNITYGSIASSETLNNNFSYLDDRISDSNTQVNSNISSILSNIATINSRITELSESLTSSVSTMNATIADYKSKTKLLVKKSGMVPNWGAGKSISFTSGTNYTAASNGYVLVLPEASGKGNLTVNGKTVYFKTRDNAYDNAASLAVIPVKSGDVLSTTVACSHAYFVPAAEISVENF